VCGAVVFCAGCASTGATTLHDAGRPVPLLMNNVYRGYAVRNVRMLVRLLADELE